MSHLSPPIFLLWSTLTTASAVFYVYHLWHFDRFQCLNIFRASRNGAFTRFMSYTYIAALPLFFTFSTGFAVIKYREGYITLPSGAVIPKPYDLWIPKHQAWYRPLNLIFALAWSNEATTHVEELCFWLFLIRSGPSPVSWFKSIYFKIWAFASAMAFVLVPVVAIETTNNPLTNEAWIIFVGSTLDLIITLGFLPILWVFPRFVQNVKNEGADNEAIMRLAKYHDLNTIRTAFRFLFVVPLLMLSIDGLHPHTHELNDSLVWTEFLAMASSVGCFLQGAITLMIFFPRSVEIETRRWLREPSAKSPRKLRPQKLKKKVEGSIDRSPRDSDRPTYLLTNSPVQTTVPLASMSPVAQPYRSVADEYQRYSSSSTLSTASLDSQKQWRTSSAVEMAQTLNPRIHSFISPISFDPSDFPDRL